MDRRCETSAERAVNIAAGLTLHSLCAYTPIGDAERFTLEIECTCSALRMAARRLSQSFDAALASETVSVSQYAVLSTLAKWRSATPPTVGDLAEILALDRTTLTHNLRPLERDGLVALMADGGDRRMRRVALTPEGREKRDRCLPLWRAAQARFDASFGAEPSRILRESLVAIARQTDTTPPVSGTN